MVKKCEKVTNFFTHVYERSIKTLNFTFTE